MSTSLAAFLDTTLLELRVFVLKLFAAASAAAAAWLLALALRPTGLARRFRMEVRSKGGTKYGLLPARRALWVEEVM
eukprot:scaffold438927_cov42-Prasinocladus_malaysianus.AAC.1